MERGLCHASKPPTSTMNPMFALWMAVGTLVLLGKLLAPSAASLSSSSLSSKAPSKVVSGGLSDRTMEVHGLLGCEDAPYVARRFLQNDPSPRRALAHLQRVISQEPGCSKAHFELGQMTKSAAVGDVRVAHEHFDIVHSLSRGVPETHGDIDWYAMPLELQSMFPSYKSSRLKMQHDAQQLAMLLQAGKLGGGTPVHVVRTYVPTCNKLLSCCTNASFRKLHC